MTNAYYNHGSFPITRSKLSSAQLRAELSAIAAAFDKLPDPVAGASKGFGGGSVNGVTMTSSTVDSTPIGQTSPSTGKFTSLQVTAGGTGTTDVVTFGQLTTFYSDTTYAVTLGISAHVALADPHTQYLLKTSASSTYLTQASAAATYVPLSTASMLPFTVNGVVRLRIDTLGNVILGANSTTSPINSKVDGACWRPSVGWDMYATASAVANMGVGTAGTIVQFYYNGTTGVGTISTNGTATTYGTTSDERLKEKVALAVDDGRLDQLEIWRFLWRSNGQADTGAIAQQAIGPFPAAVVPGTSGDDLSQLWNVDYSKFVPDLIVRAQSDHQRIAQLEAAVAQLLAEIARLR